MQHCNQHAYFNPLCQACRRHRDADNETITSNYVSSDDYTSPIFSDNLASSSQSDPTPSFDTPSDSSSTSSDSGSSFDGFDGGSSGGGGADF
jgi:uncharacterized membrane protein YgcG